jgi:hypothetical protein
MKFSDDGGSALIEFVGFGLLLQVLLLASVIQINGSLQDKILAESIARHSLRSYVLTGVDVQTSAHEILASFGSAAQPVIELSCQPDCQSSLAKLQILVRVGSAHAKSAVVR